MIMTSDLLNLLSQLVREGYLCVWEISEGGTKSLYAMKLVPPKDLGSTINIGTIH